MKNKSILLLTFTLIISSVNAQFFEGEIIYRNKCTSKSKNFTSEQLEAMLGNKQDYFIKSGNYKSISNGKALKMELYDYHTNIIYNQRPNSDTLYSLDASINEDEIINYTIKKNTEKILGINCDALISKTKSGTSTYYYSSRYKVESLIYKNHKYGNWAFYVNMTNALPLKFVIETDQYIIEQTATEIKPLNLDKSIFNIDPNMAVKKP